MTIAESKLLDFALGHVDNEESVKTMEHYLFHGTQIQRNYCALYFGRRGEYLIIRKAYDEGLLDAKQAFSRYAAPWFFRMKLCSRPHARQDYYPSLYFRGSFVCMDL